MFKFIMELLKTVVVYTVRLTLKYKYIYLFHNNDIIKSFLPFIHTCIYIYLNLLATTLFALCADFGAKALALLCMYLISILNILFSSKSMWNIMWVWFCVRDAFLLSWFSCENVCFDRTSSNSYERLHEQKKAFFFLCLLIFMFFFDNIRVLLLTHTRQHISVVCLCHTTHFDSITAIG